MIFAFLGFIIILCIAFALMSGKEYTFKTFVADALLVVIFSVYTLMYPLITDYVLLEKVFNVLLYTLQSTLMNQDMSIIDSLLSQGGLSHIYYLILQILFALMPILTVSFILNYVTDLITGVRFRSSIRKEHVHIFSCINNKSEMFAKKLREKGTSKEGIIFASSKDKDSQVKGTKVDSAITDMHIKNDKKELVFYALSTDLEQNINDGLELIQQYKGYSNVKIYVLCNDKNASLIFDSVEKGGIQLEIVNEVERTLYNLLDTKPLFENMQDNTISVLIIGCGHVGSEFLREATWCSVMPKINYKATVIDLKANEIKEKINIEAPEFLENYNINFIEADYKSKQMQDFIKKNADINYIMVSMDTDSKNLDASILLREKFMKIHNTMPGIYMWCSNDIKMNQINHMKTWRGLEYNIYAFGSDKDIYYDNKIIDSKFENIARDVHCAYSDKTLSDKEKTDEYNEYEYNKRSSRASALHIRYKFYSILGNQYVSDMKENQEKFKIMYNDELENLLVNVEHDRWNAYVRSIGYTCASPNEVKKYIGYAKKHENTLTKQHPAIVPNEDLDKVTKELKKIETDVDLRDYDIRIIRGLKNGKIEL